MKKVLFLKPSGEITLEKLPVGDWKDVTELLDGWMEIVRPMYELPRPYVLVVDEEGVLKGLPINPLASMCYGSGICGPAVIMAEGWVDGEPDLIGLTDDQITYAIGALRRFYVDDYEPDPEEWEVLSHDRG